MHESIRNQALRYTAKLALGSITLACGGKSDAPIDAATDATVAEDSPSDAVDETLDATVCTGPVDIDAAISDEVYQCCLDTIADASDLDAGDFAQANCCEALLTHIRYPMDADTTYGTLDRCCYLLLDPPSISFCNPWGPPTPPAMPYEWLAAS